MAVERSEKRKLRQNRVRRKAVGVDQRPRLSVFRSLHHIYAQVISDESGRTLAAASTETAGVREGLKSKRNLAAAKAVGKAIAERCLQSGISTVVFDRNGFLYHGRVKAVAASASARWWSQAITTGWSDSAWARPTKCPRRFARASNGPRKAWSACRFRTVRSRTKWSDVSARAASCCGPLPRAPERSRRAVCARCSNWRESAIF